MFDVQKVLALVFSSLLILLKTNPSRKASKYAFRLLWLAYIWMIPATFFSLLLS